MISFSREQLESVLPYPLLIDALRDAFRQNYTVPMRHHHDFENPQEKKDSTLLLMPAWEAGQYLGVKMVTVSPNNGQYGLPAIQGMYVLFDAHKGSPLAMMDAPTLTALRTAAASALAASYLAPAKSQTLLMIGTGRLAPELIRAHATIRPIEEVYVWGRNEAKAKALAQSFEQAAYGVKAVSDIESILPEADIVSCATLSEHPLVLGQWLRPGQHIDLVGAYRPNMREADDEVIRSSSVFVDTYAGACKECGDIAIPLQTGVLTKEAIKADLFDLARSLKPGRQQESEITCFKSVGHALEDLAAAKLAYEALL
ncbi:MAG: ornithine cyclodeaminase family protein [Bacteroidota bacterium]